MDPTTQAFHQQQIQHMLNAANMQDHHGGQLNSYHPQFNHQMQGPVMNGVGGMQLAQVFVDFITII